MSRAAPLRLDLRTLAAQLALLACVAVLAASCGSGAVSQSGSGNPTGGPGGAGTATVGQGGSGHGGVGQAGRGGASGACTLDADCKSDPAGHVCDTKTGACVPCLPGKAGACGKGQYCDAKTAACASGCGADADCPDPKAPACDLTTHACVACDADSDCRDPAAPHCDPKTNACATCVLDGQCAPGNVCSGDVCVPGCSAQQPCAMGKTCCGTTCADVTNDRAHCGSCATPCPFPPANETASCAAGMCSIACKPGWADCDGNAMNGCEQNTLLDGPCLCAPGATQSCYDGLPGTLGVGPCKAGKQACAASGTSWGLCVGEVVPIAEICANNIDDDCNGKVDDVPDIDGDGWTVCNGDCCEVAGPKCANPALVNPGAYEILNNGVDDDCNPATSDTVAPAACEPSQKLTGVTPNDLAQAFDLCQFTTANAPLPQKIWGVIKAEQVLADGSAPGAGALANIQNSQSAVLTKYGTGGVVPKKGPTFAGISSGWMRYEGQAGYVAPNGGTAFNTSVTPPAVYLAQHGGALPATAGCSGQCVSGSGANDSVDLRLTIRVPTNVLSFSYDFRFFTAEYWTWHCTAYNDFYLALLTSGAVGIPKDHNISFDSQNNPVSVNNGFFEVCQPEGCYTCPAGTGDLAGTGMELPDTNFNNFLTGDTGGATRWLTTDAPVVPGETMVLELMIWDTTDHVLDSNAIFDNFRWNPQASLVGTHE